MATIGVDDRLLRRLIDDTLRSYGAVPTDQRRALARAGVLEVLRDALDFEFVKEGDPRGNEIGPVALAGLVKFSVRVLVGLEKRGFKP